MRKLTFFIVLLLCTSAFVATDIFLPALPAIMSAFDTTETHAQLSISFYTVALCISQLMFGSISDRYGRRKTILVGLSIGIMGLIMTLLASTIQMFLFGRVLQGIGLAAPTTLARAIVPDLCKGVELARCNAYLVMAIPFVLTISPIIGGYLQEQFGWQSIFQVLLGYITVLLAICWIFLPETNKHLDRQALKLGQLANNYLALFSNRRFMAFSLCAACGSGGMMAYITESPFLLQSIGGLTPVEFGWTSCGLCLAITGSGYLSSFFVRKVGYLALVGYGAYFVMASGILLYVLSSVIPAWLVWSTVGCMMLFLIGNTFISVNASAGAMTDLEENIGLGSAVFATIRLAFGGVVSILIAIMPVVSPKPLAACFFLFGLIGALIFKALFSRTEMTTSTAGAS